MKIFNAFRKHGEGEMHVIMPGKGNLIGQFAMSLLPDLDELGALSYHRKVLTRRI